MKFGKKNDSPKIRNNKRILRSISAPENIPPAIIEEANEDDIEQQENSENLPATIFYVKETKEKVDARKTRYSSDSSTGNNVRAQNGNFKRNNSLVNSIQSSRRSSQQSLPVIREQYCCFPRWTKCERAQGLTIAILAIVILILLVGIGIMWNYKSSNFSTLTFRF